MVDDILLPKFILARGFGHFRQQIGSGLEPKRNGAHVGVKTRANVIKVRAPCSRAQSGHFEGTSVQKDLLKT